MDIDIPQEAARATAALPHTHVLAKVVPQNMEHLSYEIAVPNTWASAIAIGPVPVGPLEPRSIGLFASANADGAPVIGVTATLIPYEIAIDAWARLIFASEGWTTLSSSWFPGPSGLFFDITGERTIDETRHIRRCAVSVSGTHVLTVNCQCAREHWDEVKDDFWIAMITFELAAKAPAQTEPWVRGSAVAPAFEFAHPASWLHERVEAKEPDVSAVDVRLPDADGITLLSYLQVRAQRTAMPAPDLFTLEQQALARLESSGFAPSAPARPMWGEDDPRSIAVEGWLGGFTSAGLLFGSEVISRRGYMLRGGVVITISALTPPPNINPLVELRTRRAFEIARATLIVAS